MKTLQISHSDHIGGAAIAAVRLHQGLAKIGTDTSMLVHERSLKDSSIHQVPKWNRALRRFRSKVERIPQELKEHPTLHTWSLSRLPSLLPRTINSFRPDIVNLHAVDGMLGVPDFKRIHAPIVWTAHDEWPASSGYHFSLNHYIDSNDASSTPLHPLAQKFLNAKMEHWADLPLTIVSPSKWLADLMREAPHFKNNRVELIPNGFETLHAVGDRRQWRKEMGIHPDDLVITYGAGNALQNPRKGDDLFFESVHEFSKLHTSSKIILMIFGDQPDLPIPQVPYRLIRHGSISDSSTLAQIYGSSDCFVCPSRADNLPNTIPESFCMGTPCVGFRIGGIPDMIQDNISGFTADPFDVKSLAQAILNTLLHPEKNIMRHNVSERFKKLYSSKIQADSYRSLYEDIIRIR